MGITVASFARFSLRSVLVILSLGLVACAGAGATNSSDNAVDESGADCQKLKALIDKTYNFKPSQLTDEQITAKSAEMDVVWNTVGTNPKVYLPCLRPEIDGRTSDTFFRFNASNLIFKHDQSPETKKLVIEMYAQADLADINLRYWLPPIAQLGREGFDVTKAGETWVRFPKPVYYLPQHGTRPIDKGVGALGIFGSMDEAVATPALARLGSEANTDFRSVVLWLLVSQATPESDRGVEKLIASLPQPLGDRLKADLAKPKTVVPRDGTPKISREVLIKTMNELLENKPEAWIRFTTDVSDGERDVVAVFTEADLPLIRKVRRYYAANATPHSPEWYTSFTEIINTLRARADTKSKSASN